MNFFYTISIVLGQSLQAVDGVLDELFFSSLFNHPEAHHHDGHHHHLYEEWHPFEFSYGVHDPHTHQDYSEHRWHQTIYVWLDQYCNCREGDEHGNMVGEYSVALPDGRIQHVRYNADTIRGTIMEVTYEGEAHHPDIVLPPVVKSLPPTQPPALRFSRSNNQLQERDIDFLLENIFQETTDNNHFDRRNIFQSFEDDLLNQLTEFDLSNPIFNDLPEIQRQPRSYIHDLETSPSRRSQKVATSSRSHRKSKITTVPKKKKIGGATSFASMKIKPFLDKSVQPRKILSSHKLSHLGRSRTRHRVRRPRRMNTRPAPLYRHHHHHYS